jgi:hypothetical protein
MLSHVLNEARSPLVLKSDNGSAFGSQEFDDWLKSGGSCRCHPPFACRASTATPSPVLAPIGICPAGHPCHTAAVQDSYFQGGRKIRLLLVVALGWSLTGMAALAAEDVTALRPNQRKAAIESISLKFVLGE